MTTLDVLSGGRAWLGVGAAWNEEEAAGLGIPFPPRAERFERLEETLQIVTRMFSGDAEPFTGKHYQLARPVNSPPPLARPPIMVGGAGEKKTLRLVAQYGDACNIFAGPDLPRKLDVLREHCASQGRDYDSIYKTAYLPLRVGADGRGVDELLTQLRELAGVGVQAVLGFVPDVYASHRLEVIGREVIPIAETF